MNAERSDGFEPADPNSSRDRSVTLQVSGPFRSVETKTPPPPEGGGRGSLRSPGNGDGGDEEAEPPRTPGPRAAHRPHPPGEPAPPKPRQFTPHPRPLRPRARELLARKLDYLATTGTTPERAQAVDLRRVLRSGTLTDDELQSHLDRLRWITPERLKRHQLDAGRSRKVSDP